MVPRVLASDSTQKTSFLGLALYSNLLVSDRLLLLVSVIPISHSSIHSVHNGDHLLQWAIYILFGIFWILYSYIRNACPMSTLKFINSPLASAAHIPTSQTFITITRHSPALNVIYFLF
jgi:hypothetical protein